MHCYGLVVWVLWSAAASWWLFCATPLGAPWSTLQQREQHLPSASKFQPELRVAAVATVVTTASCRVTSDPAATYLLCVS